MGTNENSMFWWKGGLYIFENVPCYYSAHAARWFPAFVNASYARIRHFDTGEIVANISAKIGYGFITPFPDYEQDKLWLFGSQCNRCRGRRCRIGSRSRDTSRVGRAGPPPRLLGPILKLPGGVLL